MELMYVISSIDVKCCALLRLGGTRYFSVSDGIIIIQNQHRSLSYYLMETCQGRQVSRK